MHGAGRLHVSRRVGEYTCVVRFSSGKLLEIYCVLGQGLNQASYSFAKSWEKSCCKELDVDDTSIVLLRQVGISSSNSLRICYALGWGLTQASFAKPRHCMELDVGECNHAVGIASSNSLGNLCSLGRGLTPHQTRCALGRRTC